MYAKNSARRVIQPVSAQGCGNIREYQPGRLGAESSYNWPKQGELPFLKEHERQVPYSPGVSFVRLEQGEDMKLDQSVYFPPFRLDPCEVCLWNEAERIRLIPKDFAMLAYLATHPHRLVSYEELFKAVWGGTIVSHGVLKVHLCRIRRALNDSAANPRFIETVSRQGYRFIAPLTSLSFPVSLRHWQLQDIEAAWRDLQSAFALVDQRANAAQLHEWLEDLAHKVRSLAFLSHQQLPHAA
jgi:DNA-binding winged helix-turn-helix (wHTH) protein